MTALSPRQWEVDGLLLGDGTPFAVLETSGLEDSADAEQSSSPNWGDGQAGGVVRLTDRASTITIGFHDAETDEADKDALRAVASPRTNRQSDRLLRWRHNGDAKRANYQPAPGRSLVIPGDYRHLVHGFSDGVTLRLQHHDPYVYSDGYTDGEDVWHDGPLETEVAEATPGDATDIEVTNLGSVAANSPAPPGSTLGTYQWTITAGDAGCTWPFVMNVDFPGEYWMLAEELGADAVASASWSRQSRRNTTVRYAEVRGPDGSPIPSWLCLRPGVNNIRFGCFAGSITATFEHRSTWG